MAVTPHRTWISLQTRVANSLSDLLGAQWWPQNLLWDPNGGYWVPLRGYLGPGSYIEQNGTPWPTGRYAQYRVNFWTMTSGPAVFSRPLSYPPPDGFKSTPALYYATLFYGNPGQAPGEYGKVYLPIVVKNHP